MEFMDSMMVTQASDRSRRMRLTLTPQHDCWVLLPPQLANQLYAMQAAMPVVLRLIAEPVPGQPPLPPRLVAWAGGVSPGGNGTLGMPAALAHCLGYSQGMVLLVDALPPGAVMAAESAAVEPASDSDWEVLELNAGHLEDHLLAQVGVLSAGQEFPVWVRQQALVRLRCTSTTPAGAPCVRLLPGTELYVAPRPRLGAGRSQGEMVVPTNSAKAAESAGANEQQEEKVVQQQQMQSTVSLRVQAAGNKQLLHSSAEQSPVADGVVTGPHAKAAAAAAAAAAPGITSWLTTAVLVSPATAAQHGLQLGSFVQLTARAGAGAVGRLAVVLLPDEAVAQGHVALTPPLQLALGAPPHTYVRLQQLPMPLGRPLQQVPALALHPIVSGVGESASVSAPEPHAAAGGSSGKTGSWQQERAAAAQTGTGNTDKQQGTSSPLAAAAGMVAQLAGLLQHPGASISGMDAMNPYQPAASGQAVQQQQGGQNGADALAVVRQHPELAAHAVAGWLRCQAAALVALAAGSGIAGVGVPMLVPMLMHVGLQHAAMHNSNADNNSASNAQSSSNSSRGSRSDISSRDMLDHLMLLLPEQQQGQRPAASAGGKPSVLRPQLLPPDAVLHQPFPVHSSQPRPKQQPQAAAFAVDFAGPIAATLARLPADSVRSKGLLLDAPAPGALLPSDLDWLGQQLEACLKRVAPRLSVAAWNAARDAGLPLPGGLLVTGASGSGKTALLQVLSACVSHHQRHLAHTLHIDCKALAGSSFGAAAGAVAAVVREGLLCCPAVVVLEDLDLLCPASGDGPEQAMHDQDTVARLSEWLADVMSWVRSQDKPLVFAASAAAAGGLPAVLRQAGCLDCEVRLPAPGAKGRATILVAQLRQRGVAFSRTQLQALAAKAEGYDARDLAVLLDRAVHAALTRRVAAPDVTTLSPAASASPGTSDSAPALSASPGTSNSAAPALLGSQGPVASQQQPHHGAPASTAQPQHQQQLPRSQQQQQQQQQDQPDIVITDADLESAFSGFVPAAFWNVSRAAASTEGQLQGWEDVGGLQEAVWALQEALVLPSKYAALVAHAPLRLRTGLLLYGPPGCGKTHVVAAAAAATKLRFISVKGPELLNKYIGQSEAAVRELFARASAAAPCILFFDEFDAIAPPRGHDSTGVTDRVVNQLLTELDGVEGLKGVAVVGATSRPDLIDAALLRPGRLDRLVYCGFPDASQRLQILHAAARKLPLTPDVDLQWLAAQCEGFTGADLGAVLSEAQLLAVHDELDRRQAQEQQQQQQQQQEEGQARETASAAVAGVADAGESGTGAGTATDDAVMQPTGAMRTAAAGPSGAQQQSAEPAAAPRISMAHVARALQAARPSLPPAEQRRLAAVYARFQQSRDPGIANRQGPSAEDKGKRATLA